MPARVVLVHRVSAAAAAAGAGVATLDAIAGFHVRHVLLLFEDDEVDAGSFFFRAIGRPGAGLRVS